MKYFLDTEFIEGFHKPFFGKKRHFIDLISIGIVAEDGREYYAVSNEFNPKDADRWVKQNVLYPIAKTYIPDVIRRTMHIDRLVRVSNPKAKSNKQIAEEIFQFCTEDVLSIEKAKYYNIVKKDIEFYGYYSDYDWVVFCSLFGRMIDLPEGFPMYCKDLKQTLDEKVNSKNFEEKNTVVIAAPTEDRVTYIKLHPKYPKQENEHNALDDAKWNFKLFKFLQTL